MQNLEQLRAAAALKFWHANKDANKGDDDGKIVQKLPALVMSNGLLATAAFAKSKSKVDERGKYQESNHEQILRNVLAAHVPQVLPAALTLPPGFIEGERTDLDRAIRALVNGTSIQLQQVTAEALAYLGYLKRFAP